MSAPTLIFDVETGVRPEVLAHPEEWFKPDARLTDPVKIKASLADKASDGALSPVTGMVLAVGYHHSTLGAKEIIHDGTSNSEYNLLCTFIENATAIVMDGGKIVGYNIRDFDLPFLFFRANACGLKVGASLGQISGGRWYPSGAFVDLMELVRYGKKDFAGYGLDRVCRAFGIQGKSGSGKDFQALLASDPEQARAYLRNDVEITRQLAERIL